MGIFISVQYCFSSLGSIIISRVVWITNLNSTRTAICSYDWKHVVLFLSKFICLEFNFTEFLHLLLAVELLSCFNLSTSLDIGDVSLVIVLVIACLIVPFCTFNSFIFLYESRGNFLSITFFPCKKMWCLILRLGL